MAEHDRPGEGEQEAELKLYEALVAVERAIGITPPIGVDRIPPPSRFRTVLLEIRLRLCPHREAIRARLASDGGELVAVVADVLISGLTHLALPVATISRRIASIGLDRFCEQPTRLLDD